MGRPSLEQQAIWAARGGGPPLPMPQGLHDMGPILARWPLMLMYDPETGDLWWRYIVQTQKNLAPKQYIASHPVVRSNKRTRVVRIDGYEVSAGKLVWLLHHGRWPDGRLGRRDNDQTNDRIENLFEMPEGAPGKRGRVPVRPAGVARLYDRWQAYAPLGNGKRKHLGVHRTQEAAIAARAAWDAAQAASLVDDLV